MAFKNILDLKFKQDKVPFTSMTEMTDDEFLDYLSDGGLCLECKEELKRRLEKKIFEKGYDEAGEISKEVWESIQINESKNKPKWQYALITKQRVPHIIILSNTLKDFDQAIDTLYWNQHGLAPKGSNFTKEDLLKNYLKRRISITPLEEK
jgi:hypothetical protein